MTTGMKYVEKLNIASTTISKAKRIILNNIVATVGLMQNGVDKIKEVEKQSFHIIGPAGIGKTQITKQLVQELEIELGEKFEYIIIKSPVVTRDDFMIPMPKQGTRKFEMLYSDFIPESSEYGLFVIDEFSRGDHTLQQLMWQAQNEGKIHLHEFPKYWFVISTDNPDDEEYQIDTMEDAAGLRRQVHIYVDSSVADFLNHAKKMKFHKQVISYIQTKPNHLYDFLSQKKGSVYANPASWEAVSDQLYKYEFLGDLKKNLDNLMIVLSGIINQSIAVDFIQFIQDNNGSIKPCDIVTDFPLVKPQILELMVDNNNAVLSELMNNFVGYLVSERDNTLMSDENKIENIVDFVCTIPSDIAAVFVSALNEYDFKSAEFKYFSVLQMYLIRNPRYKKDFYEKLSNMVR